MEAMTASLGAELRRFREAAGLSQRAVATELGVQRPTLSQWETDKHKPSVEHLARLDDLYGAEGGLAGYREVGAKRLSYLELSRRVSDALIARLIRDDAGAPLGWSHDLSGGSPTPLSTAFVLRTLQMLDQTARVDVHAIAGRLAQRHENGGWSNRPGRVKPEANAVVLTAMAMLGHVANLDDELTRLENSLDDFARTRPYIIAAALECVLAIRPDSPIADRLTEALLAARTDFPAGRLWAQDAAADPEIVEPSLAHTARAISVLRQVRSETNRAEVDDAVESALPWIIEGGSGPGNGDSGVTELLRSDPADRRADVVVNHFTATWTLRAMAGIDNVPHARRETALDVIWDCYTEHGLWAWRADGTLRSWTTYDAVGALQAHVLSICTTPVAAS